MRAGAAQVDITPSAGTHLTGAIGLRRPAALVADPLHAKALVVEDDDRRVCFLTLDVTIVTEPYSRIIRDQAAERLGLAPEAVMVHATQTHSAPSLGHFMVDPDFPALGEDCEWVAGGEKAYGDWAAERALEAMAAAIDNLQPVKIGLGSGIEGRFAFNRRAVMRDGQVTMPGRGWPGGVGPTGIRYIEGPIDPEVGVLCFRTDDLRLPALLLHHTCHPVHVFPGNTVSADWPGAWAEAVRQAHGPDCVGLVLNGCCGNINPWPPFDPDYVEDHRRMGSALADMTEKVLRSLTFSEAHTLDWRSERVRLALRGVPAEELAWAERILSRAPQPLFEDEAQATVAHEWMAAASIYSVHLMRQRDPMLEYEIQVFRLGEAAIVGLPGEPFVEGQLAIKLASPVHHTFVAHCCTQYVGYVPTQEALTRGGHEVNTRYWAKLTPEALGIIVDQAVQMV